MNKKQIIILVVLLIVLVAGIYAFSKYEPKTKVSETVTEENKGGGDFIGNILKAVVGA